MIVISSSMPKSGSTLVCNYQEDMLDVAGIRSGQAYLREAFDGRYVHLDLPAIIRLVWISLRYGTTVVKTHYQPNVWIRLLIRLGLAKVTYCYRDPRDVILSAIDHGQRSRNGLNLSSMFASWRDVEQSIPLVAKFLRACCAWDDFGQVLFIRYERLMQDKLGELKAIASFLEWDLSEQALGDIVEKHERLKHQAHNFNKGTIQRYQTEMTDSEIEACNEAFYDFLVRFNYEW